jgi:hypothetical protein
MSIVSDRRPCKVPLGKIWRYGDFADIDPQLENYFLARALHAAAVIL